MKSSSTPQIEAVKFLEKQQADWKKGWLIEKSCGERKDFVLNAKEAIGHLQVAIDALHIQMTSKKT